MKEIEKIDTLVAIKTPKKISDSHAGRPEVFVDDKVAQFIALIQRGATVSEALASIQVSMATYSRKLKADKDFAIRMESARAYLKIASRLLIHKAIEDKKDIGTAKWYLEKEVYDKEKQNNAGNINFFTQINNFAGDDRSKFVEGEVINESQNDSTQD